MLIKFSNWIVSGIVLLMLSGCPNSADESSTSSFMEPKIDVTYSSGTGKDDVDIGVPVEPLMANIITEFNVKLEIQENYANNLDITYNTTDRNFDPEQHKSFTIRSDNMIVTDSENNDHLLALHVIPLNDDVGRMMVLATLDGKSISFLTMSHARQALFLDTFSNPYYASMIKQDNFVDPSTPYSSMNRNWVGKAFKSNVAELTYGASYRLLLPLSLNEPCYQPITVLACTTDLNSLTNKQGQTRNYLQPLAPLGVRNKNWNTYDYTSPLIDGYVIGTGPLLPQQADQVKAETIEALKTSTLTDDIGWFGLSAEDRSQIDRLHYIRINIEFEENGQIVAASKMRVMGLQRKTYTPISGESIQLTDSLSSSVVVELVEGVGYSAVDLDFKVDDGQDTIPPPT
jgi:hypothetical protein